MRLRFTLLACALAACVGTAVPGAAGAAPVHNRGLTIHAVPNPIIAGEAVLIYGHLGLPALGLVGAATASASVQWLMMAGVAGLDSATPIEGAAPR